MKNKFRKVVAVLQAAAVFGGYGVGIASVSAQEPTNLEPWGFFAGSLFNYTSTSTEITYHDTSKFNYALVTRDNANGGVSRSVYANDDRNWNGWIKTNPNSQDNRFELKSSCGGVTTANGAGAQFTIPETGLWAVECDALNKGASGNYGSSNLIRICMLDKDETMETSENCYDFSVRNANASGGGYYKSEGTLLEAGGKIMMRLTQGKDDWGDSIWVSYKIHKVNVKGDILETYDLNQIGVQTKRTVVSGEDSLTSNAIEADINSLSSDAKFGNWEFFKVNQFYERATAANRSEDSYYSESDMTEKHGKMQTTEVVGGVSWSETQSAYKREGMTVLATNSYNNGDNNWNAGLEIYPGSADKLVRFIPAPHGQDQDGRYGIAVRFTVPETGVYSLRTDVKNYGWLVDEKVGYGTENYGRVTFFTGTETTQSADNTSVFAIPDRRATGDSFDSDAKELTAGDRIWLEIYNGSWANLDDFIGHVIVEKYDSDSCELGLKEVEKTYNLGESSFTKLGNWNLFTAAKDEADTFKYAPLQAAEVTTLANTLSGFNSYAARTSSYWGATSGKVTMKNEAPSFGWNSGDENAVVRTGDNDMIVTYDISESGKYNIKTATQLLSGSGATVTVSITNPKKTPLETTETTPVVQYIASSEKNVGAAVKELNAGDRIEFRISNTGTDEAVLRINPSVQKAEEKISVVSGKANVSKVNTLSAGSKIDITRTAISDDAMIAALYEKTNDGLKLVAVDVSNGIGVGLKSFSASVTIPSDADASKTVLKIMMLDLQTLSPEGTVINY